MTVRVGGARSANIIFPRLEGGDILFDREREPSQPYRRTFRTRHRTWKVDLLRTGSRSTAPRAGVQRVLSGYVTEESTGRPLGGVTVVLNTNDSTVTRSDGTFDLIGAAWRLGDNSVIAKRTGYQDWTKIISLDVDASRLELSVQLQH